MERDLGSREHTTQMSLARTIPDGATVRRRGRGVSRSAESASAGTDTAATSGMNQVDCHDRIPGSEGQTVNNGFLMVELTDHGEFKPAEADFNYASDSSDSDISESNRLGAEEAYQSTSVTRFQSLACLNVNSNGKRARCGSRSAKKTAMAVDGDVSTRQSETAPLAMEQVGLTLPMSGVMLHMMVSPEEKQKLLANTEVKMINYAPKKRGRKSDVKTTDTQTDNSPDLSVPSRSWADVRDVNVNQYNISSHSDSQRAKIQAPKNGFFVSDEPPEGSVTLRMPANQENQRRLNGYAKEDVMQIPFIYERQGALQHPANTNKDVLQPSFMANGFTAGKLLYGQGRGMEVQPLLPGPSWRFDNEHIDVCNHDHIQTVACRREEPEGRQQVCTYGSVTTDPLKHYLVAPSSDVLKRHSDQYSEREQHDKRARHSVQDYMNNPTGYSQQMYRRSSRDENEDITARDDSCANSAKPVTTRMLTSQVNRGSRYPLNSDRTMKETDMADGRTMRQPSDSHLTSLPNEEFTPFTTLSHTSSSPMDTGKIAQITEYTENMRKNMRQDYRNLSILFKSFTEDLQESNNNQTSQSPSDVNKSEQASETNDKERCLIM